MQALLWTDNILQGELLIQIPEKTSVDLLRRM